jgi:BioD-like phosphotransacetylase family protein
MPFPADPNAPGGPRRSEYVRRSYSAAKRPPADRHDFAEALADPALSRTGILTLLLMRRMETRMVVTIFGV